MSTAISLRLQPALRDLIDRAAQAVGKTRTEFVLESAQQQAQRVLLDRTFFVLDEARHDEFLRRLDEAPSPNAALRRMMNRRAPWDGTASA